MDMKLGANSIIFWIQYWFILYCFTFICQAWKSESIPSNEVSNSSLLAPLVDFKQALSCFVKHWGTSITWLLVSSKDVWILLLGKLRFKGWKSLHRCLELSKRRKRNWVGPTPRIGIGIRKEDLGNGRDFDPRLHGEERFWQGIIKK